MAISKTVSADAVDAKHGMTLDELGLFVQRAMRAGIDGGTIVKITATWRTTIRRAEVRGDEAEE